MNSCRLRTSNPMSPSHFGTSNTSRSVARRSQRTLGYRRELAGQGRRLPAADRQPAGRRRIAGLLLVLPASAFEAVVPALVLLASVLVAVRPALSCRLRTRAAVRAGGGNPALTSNSGAVSRSVSAAAGLLAVYGGYFGAGHGVILIALLAFGIDEQLQVVNALKNAAVTAANAAAAVVFVTVGDLHWAVVALTALGSVIDGQPGARVG